MPAANDPALYQPVHAIHLLANALAARLGRAALRRRELITDLREELDPTD